MLTALQDIIDEYDCNISGEFNSIVDYRFKHFSDSDSTSIIWVDQKFYHANADLFNRRITTGCLVTNLSPEEQEGFDVSCRIQTPEPRMVYGLLYDRLRKKNAEKGSIHSTAVIHPEAKIHESCYIGPFTSVGKCRIGAFTRIEGNCFIHDNVTIGNDCYVDAGVVIGVSGSGFIRVKSGRWIKFPQIGRTIIEDNVDIGANTYITKGALGDTIIRKGAVIGLDVGVGHNVIVGENAFITAKVLIGGSTIIGDGAVVNMCAIIRDAIRIGSNSVVGMGSVVTKSIPDNETWYGNPATKAR